MEKIAVKKGDMVEVITGADKGKTGKILRVDRKNGKLFVQGINMQKKTPPPQSPGKSTGWNYRTRRPNPSFQY